MEVLKKVIANLKHHAGKLLAKIKGASHVAPMAISSPLNSHGLCLDLKQRISELSLQKDFLMQKGLLALCHCTLADFARIMSSCGSSC